MQSNCLRKLFLTFDVEGPPGLEDHMDANCLRALYQTLKLLEEYRVKGLFFITGTVLKDIRNNPCIIRLLRRHEIGFHSSSHSLKPRISEYTDVPNYAEALKVAIQRESSDIDRFTGKIEGGGGFFRLRELFPEKEIASFRAPYDYFSPPHIEALGKLGIKSIFSGNFSETPLLYKRMVFYPRAMYIDDVVSKIVQIDYPSMTITSPLLHLFNRELAVLAMHPSSLTYKEIRRSVLRLYIENPFRPLNIGKRRGVVAAFNVNFLRLFLFTLTKLRNNLHLEITPKLQPNCKRLEGELLDFSNSIKYCEDIATGLLAHKPRYLQCQYQTFFRSVDLKEFDAS